MKCVICKTGHLAERVPAMAEEAAEQGEILRWTV